jgi:hypothetical protein
MTKPKSATSPPILILYGLDTDGRPRAAVFNAAQADLAKKVAESLELQVLRIETAEQIELARQVPSGENGAQGRNRTTDTAIFSRMLYQLSYLGAAGAASSGEAAVIEERHSHCLEHDPQNLQTFRTRSCVKSKRYVEPSLPFKTISRERRLERAEEAVNCDRNRARGSRFSTWDLGGSKRRFSCLAHDRGASGPRRQPLFRLAPAHPA